MEIRSLLIKDTTKEERERIVRAGRFIERILKLWKKHLRLQHLHLKSEEHI